MADAYAICITCGKYIDWRADEYHRTAALTFELGSERTHEMRGAEHVDVERSHPIFVRRVGDAAEERVEGRDLYEAMHLTEALDRAAHQRRALIRVGDIGGDRRGART